MVEVVPPTERECLRCGRRDVWSGEETTWVAAEVDGEHRVGTPHCLHDWDINGSYNPIAE
jgi:hypothetical protein